MRIRILMILAGLAVLWPAYVSADVGTPLVWAEAFHMVLGNAIIGVLEGWLLAKIFKLSLMRCILIMIFANYVSAWLGWTWLNQSFDRPEIDIHNGLAETWRLIVVSYVLTLLVEWPFVAWCFHGNSKALKNSFLGNLIVQTASYFLLFAGF